MHFQFDPFLLFVLQYCLLLLVCSSACCFSDELLQSIISILRLSWCFMLAIFNSSLSLPGWVLVFVLE